MKSRGASKLFTLSGGHLFSIYDGCRAEGIGRSTPATSSRPAFAAIGWAKATREPGICALTAGCGVTNGMSAIASTQADGVPAGQLRRPRPEMRWGSGVTQEIDHLPFVSPLVKSARTVRDPAKIARTTAEAIDMAAEPPLGAFVDYPLDIVFSEAESEVPDRPRSGPGRRRRGSGGEAALGSGAPGDHGRHQPLLGPGRVEFRALAEALRDPVFLNGLGRGCMPPDHGLYFARAHGSLGGCDVALVIGVPLDFRLGGGSISRDATLIRLDFAPFAPRAYPPARPRPLRRHRRHPDRDPRGRLGDPKRTARWWRSCRRAKPRSGPRSGRCSTTRSPTPDAGLPRARRLPRARCDRGRRRRRPSSTSPSGSGRPGAGTWMDPVPTAASARAGRGDRREARPSRAPGLPAARRRDFGFSGMEFDTMARRNRTDRRRDGEQRDLGARAPPDEVPLRLLARRRAPARDRYDEVVSALGCHGERSLPRRAPPGARPRLRLGQTRWSTCSPTRKWSTRAGRTWRKFTATTLAYDRARQGAVRGLRAGTPPLPEEEAAKLSSRFPTGTATETVQLRRQFSFPDFREAFGLVARGLDCRGGRPPPRHRAGLGPASLKLTTHAASGLTRNDFILAAKLDQLAEA